MAARTQAAQNTRLIGAVIGSGDMQELLVKKPGEDAPWYRFVKNTGWVSTDDTRLNAAGKPDVMHVVEDKFLRAFTRSALADNDLEQLFRRPRSLEAVLFAENFTEKMPKVEADAMRSLLKQERVTLNLSRIQGFLPKPEAPAFEGESEIQQEQHINDIKESQRIAVRDSNVRLCAIISLMGAALGFSVNNTLHSKKEAGEEITMKDRILQAVIWGVPVAAVAVGAWALLSGKQPSTSVQTR